MGGSSWRSAPVVPSRIWVRSSSPPLTATNDPSPLIAIDPAMNGKPCTRNRRVCVSRSHTSMRTLSVSKSTLRAPTASHRPLADD